MQNQESMVPETTPTESEQPEKRSQLDLIAELLTGEEAQEAPETESSNKEQGESQEKIAPPETFAELAERLGMDVKDLYNIKIPSARDGGESYTMGELKDLAGNRDEYTVKELEWEETKTRKEQEWLRAQQELQLLMSSLPKSALKPEVMDKVRQQQNLYIQQERDRTLSVIPEWRDESRAALEIKEMAAHLEAYGMPATYLNTITDHRSLKYIRDNWQREKRINAVLERVRKVEKPSNKTAKPTRLPTVSNKVDKNAPLEDKLAAINNLIRGGK